MSIIDVIGFSLSLLGIYGPILLILYLLPRNLAPRLFTLLDETQQLRRRAEELGAVPPRSEYEHRLDRSANQLARMRMESHHAQGTLNQLRVALLHGLTFKLFSLYYQIEAIKSELEVEIDKHQLNNVEIVTSAVMHSPANITATPINNHVNESTLPLPTTTP